MSSNAASILDSVKKVLGFESEYVAFDLDIIMHINTAFVSLQQLGVGPTAGFAIVDNTALWASYTSTDNMLLLNMLKSYVALSVRMVFDPPSNSFTIDSFQKTIDKYEWLLKTQMENISPPADPPTDPVFPPWGTEAWIRDVWNGNGPTGSDSTIVAAYWWDLTGLDDFPTDAAVGDLGIDFSDGNVYRKAS